MSSSNTVKIRLAAYRTKDGGFAEARRGDKLEAAKLADGEFDRLKELDVFGDPAQYEPGANASETSGGGSFDLNTATDAQLDSFVKEAKPKEVIEAAGDNPELAQRLLAAESRARGGDPRESVTKKLEAVTADPQP